ncbi:MAG: strawberry notch C-terminal domain-containing protein [Burkholderia sp.]
MSERRHRHFYLVENFQAVNMADGNRTSPKLVNWVSLNAQDAALRLIACRKAWGAVRLEIVGAQHLTSEQREGLMRLGFYRPRLGMASQLVRKDLRISLQELRQVFPDAAQMLMPQEDAAHAAPVRSGARRDDEAASVEHVAANKVSVVGANPSGNLVLEGDEGRYLVQPDGVSVLETSDAGASFLRATNEAELAACADAFTAEISGGKVMRRQDLRTFASTITGVPLDKIETSPELRRVQEAVEASLVRRLAAFADQGAAVDEIYAFAAKLLDGQPSMDARTSSSVMLQQYSSPLPMGVAAQVIVGDMQGRTVLEPTIGNGSLVSMTRASHIAGVDLDARRVASIIHGRPDIAVELGDATAMDFTTLNSGARFDAVISNPPFGKLPSAVMINGLKTNRLDHLVLMKSLDARKPDGISVFIIGGDTYVDTRAGKVSGGSRYLFNWLADHYHVDAVEIPGRVYAKQGATFPVRMVVVGGRSGDAVQVPDEIPVVQDAESLFTWAKLMAVKYEIRPDPQEHSAPPAPQAIAGAGTSQSAVAMKSPEAQHGESHAHSSPNISSAAENSYQSPYVSASRVGEATAMIPRNMQTATMLALQSVAEANGDIDDFVAERLGWSVHELGSYLSPEQVDSVALNIHAHESSEGRLGFLMGDQTGMGKGRHLAAMARYHNLQGRQVIFLTETPTLFTDFWRDLRGIGSEGLFAPLIINNGVSIIDDVSGERLVDATPQSVVSGIVAGDVIPPDYNLVMGTYSQFNRDRNKAGAAKSGWITRVTAGAALLLDESHNAAGASNTNANIALAVQGAASVSYSSATSIKEPKNLSVYSRLFPPTVDLGGLPETLQTGGEVLQEVLTGMLARDGVFVRREHDLSSLTFKVVSDSESRQARNRTLSDHLAQILESMNFLAGDINRHVSEYNKEVKKALDAMPAHERAGNRMGAVSINYFSRLFNIYRQFLLALQVDLAAERALAALANGQKPVIVLESTMEQLLREVIAEYSLDDTADDGDELSAEGAAAIRSRGPIELGEGLSFKMVLHRTLDRLSFMQTTDRYGVRERQALTSKESHAAIASIRGLIEAMPDLPVSPIDSVRQAITSGGYVCSELSGRKLSITLQGDTWTADVRAEMPKAEIVRGFNVGRDDAVILSRAGSTGVSLHSSSQFPDQRQRVLIELQLPLDIVKRMQFFGRVNRRGQVNSPIIETLSTGLVGQARPIAMANAKLRKLSANTTANQDNASLDVNVPDFLNEVGDQVAARYLESNPDVARRLDIDLEKDEDREVSYFINKLTSRLVMLSVDEQENIYAALTSEYSRLIQEMDEKGINPLKSRELDIRAVEIGRSVYETGDAESLSVFNQPVFLKTMTYQVIRDPLRSDTVRAVVEASSQMMVAGADGEDATEVPMSEVLRRISDRLADQLQSALWRALPEKFKDVEAALNDAEPNAVKKTKSRYDFIAGMLRELDVGLLTRFTDNHGEAKLGVICGIRLPQKATQASQLSAYSLRIAVPGQDRLIERSFFGLREDGEFRLMPRSYQTTTVMEEFDASPAGVETVERHVLDGNLFKAAQLAAQHRLGSSVVYTDSEGMRHRGVLLSQGVDLRALQTLPIRLDTPRLVREVLERDAGLRLSSSSGAEATGEHDTILYRNGPEMVIQCPGTRSRGGSVFANEAVTSVVGEFSGSRSVMVARFRPERLEELVDVLYRNGLSFYAPARNRELVNQVRQEAYNNESSVRKSNESGYVSLSA